MVSETDIHRFEDDGGPPLEFDRARYEQEDIVSQLETRARIRKELKRGNKHGVDRIADLLERAAKEIRTLRAYNAAADDLYPRQIEPLPRYLERLSREWE